jgi:hypothetical protein
VKKGWEIGDVICMMMEIILLKGVSLEMREGNGRWAIEVGLGGSCEEVNKHFKPQPTKTLSLPQSYYIPTQKNILNSHTLLP